MKEPIIILALAIAASSTFITAQEGNPTAGGPPGGGQRPPGGEGRPGGPGGGPGGRPVIPMVEALDLNKDGTIDADELAKAVESLKKLDKNNDGKLTEDEYRPQRPGGQGGPGAEGPGARGGRPEGQGGPALVPADAAKVGRKAPVKVLPAARVARSGQRWKSNHP